MQPPFDEFDLTQPVQRWTPRRKRYLINAYANGQISAADILAIHNISTEELTEWQRRDGEGGDVGLRRLRATDLMSLASRPLAGITPPPDRSDRRKGKKPRKLI